jgi:hypothetical protein
MYGLDEHGLSRVFELAAAQYYLETLLLTF